MSSRLQQFDLLTEKPDQEAYDQFKQRIVRFSSSRQVFIAQPINEDALADRGTRRSL